MMLLALLFAAAPEVPQPLQPWIGWVLHDKRHELCPRPHGEDEPQCVWPATLDLQLDKKSGTFTQRWTVDAEAWVPLPGDSEHWPLDVKVDGQGGWVSDKDARPLLQLKGGVHTVTGRFAWDALPESLAVPPETGLVGLTVNGKRVRVPDREEGGTLYLQKDEDAASEEEENRFDIVVHRKIDDDIPLRITTRIELFVSGKAREVSVGPALPSGFIPLALQSPLPARVEQNGMLRLQVRPGRWNVLLEARHFGQPDVLQPAPTSAEDWPQEEVWVYQAQPALRLAEVEGVDPLDPAQTTLPAEWKKLPAYRVRANDVVKLVQKRRGDEEPPPDQLTLERQVWLDFDGGGYTFSDHIRGDKLRGDRLEMATPLELGRAALAGADQFITRLPAAAGPGVEVGKGSIDVVADSRLNRDDRTLSAVGWLQGFKSVKASLYLPPGWKLLAVGGADDAPGTWFRSWSLFELFLVMLTTVGFARLFGVGAGVLAAVALVLSVPEPDAPMLAWLVVLACETGVRIVPSERVRGWLRAGRVVSWVALALVVIPFVVKELRQARYPVLEQEWITLGADGPQLRDRQREEGGLGGLAKGLAQEAISDEAEPEEERDEAPAKASKKDVSRGYSLSAPAQQQMKKKRQRMMAQTMYEHDPKAIVQTGPGLPAWRWKEYRIGFNGPVTQDQTLSLWLLSPLANFFVGLGRALTLLLLALVAFGLPGGFWPAGLRRWLGPALLVLVALPAQAAEMPSKEMLEELQARLLKPPECTPQCASGGRLLVEAQGSTLRLRLEVSAAALTAIPLPAAEKEWLPERVLLDGRVADALARSDDGTLLLRLTPGGHQVLLEGALPERETVQIPLPLKPHYVEVKAAGWTVDGVHEDGQADDNLQLSRTEKKKEGRTLEAGVLPPFVRVERTLELGLSWQVETRIVRLSPLGSAIVLEVPLLEGESVTTADVRAVGGKALVNMGAQEQERTWRSMLKERPDVVLTAKRDGAWVEQWAATASPVWHVDAKGLPPVHGAALLFRPWPGESLTLGITRPEGAKGQSLTIDKSMLIVTPGMRATDASLDIRLRSSRGGQHQVRLPTGAELQRLTVGGQTQPLRQQGDAVSFAVTPGAQSVQLAWREPRGTGFVTATSPVDLGLPSVNATLEVHAPRERWLLWTSGDGAGPAVLFYPTLLFLLLASLLLARGARLPLPWWQWLLLGLGLTQVSVEGALIVAGWFFVLDVRRRFGDRIQRSLYFNLMQLGVMAWTLVMLGVLFWAIKNGLLVDPEMQVSGNGSHDSVLRYFADRRAGLLPRATVYSVPMFVFRICMLLWSLWLARALLGWLRWAWDAYSQQGLWRRMRQKASRPADGG